LIDTNVFIYAVGAPHEYKQVCARLAREFIQERYDVNIDTELLQEVLFHFWHRRRLAEAFEVFDSIMTGFPSPIPISGREVRTAREIMETYSDLQPRDAIHAAVVLEHGLEGIVSTDRGFDHVKGVTRFDPKQL
jgi:predicted nucleic acid-binding protein